MFRASTIAMRVAFCFALTACAAQTPGSDATEPQASSETSLALSRVRLCRPEQCGPQLGLPNTLCSDGVTVSGPTGRCIREPQGKCGWEVIACPAKACPSSESCAAGEYCTVEDGDCNPAPGCRPGRVCTALCYGVCKPLPPKGPFCGGIAGIPCPGFGKCADDPSDSCDPNNGGADCGGICSCIQNVLCVQGSHFDSDPTVCSCVPDSCIQNVLCIQGSHFDNDPKVCRCVPDVPAPVQCGPRTCGADQICCSPSCGICGSKGGLCPQIACATL